MVRRVVSIAQKAKALTLLEIGVPVANVQIATGLCIQTIYNIRTKAVERGYNQGSNDAFQDSFFSDKKRPGRPALLGPKELGKLKFLTLTFIFNFILLGAIEGLISFNRAAREMTSATLREHFSVSETTALRALAQLHYRSVKPTFKPGLTQSMQDARLAFAKTHQHWTLEDWKKVIWTDETSIIIGHRRGGHNIWRRTTEVVEKTVIRPRWKGYSDFMVWGCYTYNLKGSLHIWQKETAAERREADVFLDQLNQQREPYF
jgi:hypothetical protein